MNNYYNKYKSSIGLQMISAVIIGTIFGSLLYNNKGLFYDSNVMKLKEVHGLYVDLI